MKRFNRAGTLLVALGGLVVGCATPRAVGFDPAGVEGPTRAAVQLGAGNVPDAAVYLSFSHDEVERARRLSNAGDEERARAMLSRAGADAELALAITKRSIAEKEAVQAMQLKHPEAP
ncbi:MAG: DUF4398 domain-containing protein [Myxococcaceae bacterium]